MRQFITIVALFVSLAVWSVPATKEPIVRILEDGTADTTYLHGDEHFSYRTKQRSASIEVPARAPQREMLYSFVPSQGTVRIPVILVNFSDLSFSLENANAQFDDLFNGDGGSNPNATGSVHTYYDASSFGQLDLQFEVFGPYTLSHNMAYYGANQTENGYTSHNIRAGQLVTEAVQLASNAGVNFSPYDNNDDGYVDNVSIVVAGFNEAEGGHANTIWPHYSTVNSYTKYNGKYLSGYLMISEYRGYGGAIQAGIGTYCHEFGHALGLPDLYNTETGTATSVGSWDVMCTGSYNNNGSTPPTYTAFERFMKGWLTPVDIRTAGERTLEPIETSNQALLVAASNHNLNANNPNPTEYFMVENRQAVGWDAGRGALVGTGLIVSHIAFNSQRWNYNTFNNSTPMGFNIEADFPGDECKTDWLPTLYNNREIPAKRFSQIRSHSDLSISMVIGEPTGDRMAFTPNEAELETSYLYEPEEFDTLRATLHIPAIPQENIQCFVSSKAFRFSVDEGLTWYSYPDTVRLQLTPNSPQELPVMVVHVPTRKTCNYSYALLTAQSEDETVGTQLRLLGRSPQPSHITVPVIESVANMSSTSFTLYWKEQEDADWYNYALYTLDEFGEPDYIYNWEDYTIYAPTSSIVFRNLTPNTTYYYTMKACDEKGCALRESEACAPYAVRTRDIISDDKLTVVQESNGRYTIYLPEMADGYHYLNVYDEAGRLVYRRRAPYGTFSITLPELIHGQVYILKYYSGTMKRKDLQTKIRY